MTDFNSQERTRPDNVCDLQNYRSYQSVYTCLSRGSTYDGTIIVQGYDPLKITSGISGYLRQEFRELELLDEVTRLRYAQRLQDSVQGVNRSALIHAFRTWKGTHYVPSTMHKAIRWTKDQPFELKKPSEDAVFQLVSKSKAVKSGVQHAKESSSGDIKTKHIDVAHFVPAKDTKGLATLSSDLALFQLLEQRELTSMHFAERCCWYQTVL
ncbi:hypothetical protein B0H21DRAFT_688035 [Amylocystis lapponica]|nr:hypothetical protein B0H21DRAFT_688035 [Amylocystis lapponica]